MYFIGLFIMTIGIAISVKSNLGVSPVSSIPYTMTCIWGIEMGKATIIFHIFLVFIQFLLLRKNFKLISLLQIPVGVIFGYFTTFCNYLASFFPTPDNLVIRVLIMLASTIIIAVGIFLYLPADVIPLAGEGVMSAVSQVTKIEFSKVKMAFDITMVVVSAAACLILIHNLGSVGVGTVIAAFLVGFILGIINKAFGKYRDKLLKKSPSVKVDETTDSEQNPTYVITVSREYGSCGKQIAKALADSLGFKYYDNELIKLVVEKTGYSPDFIEKNEQIIKNPVMHDFFAWYGGPLDTANMPSVESLFDREKDVIKTISQTESCVIVGRLANEILKNKKHTFNVFVSADEDTEAERISKRDNLTLSNALKKVKKVNRERAAHCKYFTSTEWGNADNYDLCIKSNAFGCDKTSKIIEDLFRKKFPKFK